MQATQGFLVRSTVTALLVLGAGPLLAQGSSTPAHGTVEKITVHGKSLEGNLEGDSADREVYVYLPPSYASSPRRRYPVVYLLHGYSLSAERWVQSIQRPDAPDRVFGSNAARDMILVSPDAQTVHNGSMYSSSVTTGDWETFIAVDLVDYIDSHYRTLAARASRGLAGHSMGGYGKRFEAHVLPFFSEQLEFE